MTFADTSFLVALYVHEALSATAQRHVEQLKESLVFTPFHRLELRTALRLRVFRREATEAQLKKALQMVESDVRDGFLRHEAIVWPDAFRQAEDLGAAHLTQVGARSGDLLLVSMAVTLEVTEFCTFDRRQAELADRAGLKVKKWRELP